MALVNNLGPLPLTPEEEDARILSAARHLRAARARVRAAKGELEIALKQQAAAVQRLDSLLGEGD